MVPLSDPSFHPPHQATCPPQSRLSGMDGGLHRTGSLDEVIRHSLWAAARRFVPRCSAGNITAVLDSHRGIVFTFIYRAHQHCGERVFYGAG